MKRFVFATEQEALTGLRLAIDTARMASPVLIHPVYDYAAGDLARAEVSAALWHHLRGAGMTFHFAEGVDTGSFQTLTCGFANGVLALNPRYVVPTSDFGGTGVIVYHNVAPRRDVHGKSVWERLALGLTRSGAILIGPNSGYAYSFVADDLAALYILQTDDRAHQFRSRDDYPAALGALLNRDFSRIEQVLLPGTADFNAAFPEIPRCVILYRDNFKNLKLSILKLEVPGSNGTARRLHRAVLEESVAAELLSAQEVGIRLVHAADGIPPVTAYRADNNFAVRPGKLSFSPGSSHFALSDGTVYRAMELFQVGGAAAEVIAAKLGSGVTIPGAEDEIVILAAA